MLRRRRRHADVSVLAVWAETEPCHFRWTTSAASWDRTESHFLGGERRRIVLGENSDGEAVDSPRSVRIRGERSASPRSLRSRASTRAHSSTLGHLRDSVVANSSSSYCPTSGGDDSRSPVIPTSRAASWFAVRIRSATPKSLGRVRAQESDGERREASRLHTSRSATSRCSTIRGGSSTGSGATFRATTKLGYFNKTRDDFRQRASRLGALRARSAKCSRPRRTRRITSGPTCRIPATAPFRARPARIVTSRSPHRPTPRARSDAASKVLEHVVAQLLFEATYDAAAGSCREYHVHWSAPLDACARLAAGPEAFLAGAAGASSRTCARSSSATVSRPLPRPAHARRS